MNRTELIAAVDRILGSDSERNLFSFVSGLDAPKRETYGLFASAVFRGDILKADLSFAYGAMAHEFEGVLDDLVNRGKISPDSDLSSVDDEEFTSHVFEKIDLEFYKSCRECFGDFQIMLVIIERNLWFCTFSILEEVIGPEWLMSIDLNKRENWAKVRESFRVSVEENPLHEYSSLPDLRDILYKQWSIFSKHVPVAHADKNKLKESFNRLLIPLRNKIFHPTRAQSLSYTEYSDLKALMHSISASNWREVNSKTKLRSVYTLPPPSCY